MVSTVPAVRPGAVWYFQYRLHLYPWKGDLETVRRLVERGDDIDARDEEHGRTVLEWAREGGYQPFIDYLLSIGATGSGPGTEATSAERKLR